MSKHGSRMLLFILLVVITIHGLWSVSLATPDAEKKTLLPVRRPSTAAVDVVTDSSSTHVVVEDKVTDVISTITPEKPPSNEIVAPVASTTPENDRSALQQNQVATTTGGEAQKSPTNTRTAFPTLANLTAKSLHEIISTDTAAMEYPNICFYGSTNFYFRKHTTMTFVMGLLTLLRNVALQSYNSALIGRGEITVLTPIKSFYSETNQSSDLLPHFTSLQEIQDFMEPVVSTYGKVNVDFAADALERATRQFQQTNCSWVVSTKLDADDFLAPGYLDWIAQKVIPSLQNHHRGAVVGGRFIGNLQYGYGRCQVITDEGPHHWPGESMGQTRVFRRKVFEDLGMPFEAPEHTKTLHVMRKSVYERYIDVSNGTEKLPKGMRGKKLLRNFLFQQEMDADLENMTGIRMVETHHAGFGAPGVWLKTQLSSHMSYKQLKKAKTFCSEAEWSTIINEAMFMNGIKSKFEYVYDTLKALNTSFYDTCKSSRTFAMFQNDATESCEKIDKQLTRDMPQLSYQQ